MIDYSPFASGRSRALWAHPYTQLSCIMFKSTSADGVKYNKINSQDHKPQTVSIIDMQMLTYKNTPFAMGSYTRTKGPDSYRFCFFTLPS
jgi:hypothetical protein